MKHFPSFAALSLAATALSPLPALAAGDGTLSACIGKATGVMRLTDAGTGCRSGEQLVTWNIQGPQGPAGGQTTLNAVVNHDGSLAAASTPPGATLTVTRIGPGSFTVFVTGLGNTCPLPMAMAYATDATMAMGGGYCIAGELSINIFNSKGAETGFVLYVSALSNPAGAAAARAAATVKRFDPR